MSIRSVLGNWIARHNQLLWFRSNGQPLERSQPAPEEDIPAPKFETLGTFEFLLEQAFDGVITAPHDEVVARYLSGGYWEELDEQQDGD